MKQRGWYGVCTLGGVNFLRAMGRGFNKKPWSFFYCAFMVGGLAACVAEGPSTPTEGGIPGDGVVVAPSGQRDRGASFGSKDGGENGLTAEGTNGVSFDEDEALDLGGADEALAAVPMAAPMEEVSPGLPPVNTLDDPTIAAAPDTLGYSDYVKCGTPEGSEIFGSEVIHLTKVFYRDDTDTIFISGLLEALPGQGLSHAVILFDMNSERRRYYRQPIDTSLDQLSFTFVVTNPLRQTMISPVEDGMREVTTWSQYELAVVMEHGGTQACIPISVELENYWARVVNEDVRESEGSTLRCHPERSDGSPECTQEILHFIQDDTRVLQTETRVVTPFFPSIR